jgi:predicted esterase
VLAGGDGSEGSHPFVKRIYKRGLPAVYLVAQPVAVKWTAEQRIVWPREGGTVSGMRFSTEEFVEAVIADVRKRYEIDRRYVFTLSWSSGGPAAYAVSLGPDSAVTGSYVAMSVFNRRHLPPLARAKGHCYYIEHSPDDRTCPFGMARRAKEELSKNGAKVTLSTYQGGHGWRGDVYGRIRKGTTWLEANTRD